MLFVRNQPTLIKLLFSLLSILVIISCDRIRADEADRLESTQALPLKILIPLYSYPNWYDGDNYLWQKVITAAPQVPITAIINPHNGPNAAPPNSDYVKGLQDLRNAGVTIIGYVYTQYGDRPIAEVKADIDLYERYYNLNGIFLDEAASDRSSLAYYQQLYQYIKTKTNLKTVVLNQGTHVDEAYLSQPAADIVVAFEDYGRKWRAYQPQPYLKSYRAEHFATLIHSVANPETMKKHIELAKERNFGYIYITNDSPDSRDRDPWNSLPSYWENKINYLRSSSMVNK